MNFDNGWRRLMTGARNGTIKIWNIQNGHNLHQLEAVTEAEVTGIVPLPDKKVVLAVGWSRIITQYDDSDPDGVKAFSVGPMGTRAKPIDLLAERAQTCTYGIRGIELTDKSLLGSRVEQELAKKTANRQRRRGYREVDMSNTNPFGRLCCPFKALATPALHDIEFPGDLPLTPRMKTRGYTSATMTVDGVRDMNLSYNYSNDSPIGGLGKMGLDDKPYKLPSIKKSKTQIGSFRKSTKPGKPVAAP